MTDTKCLIFAPFLPVGKHIQFADWTIGRLSDFEGKWLSNEFETLARTFLNSFRYKGKSFSDKMAIFCPVDSKLGSWSPAESDVHKEKYQALQHAVTFSCLDANQSLSVKQRQWNEGIITSDNTEIYAWPLDTDSKFVTLSHNAPQSWLDARPIDDELLMPVPIEVNIPLGTGKIDKNLLDEIYKILYNGSKNGDTASIRVLNSIKWLSKAWRNTESITYEDRIAFLKTGFEALSGKSTVWGGSKWLRMQYEELLDGDKSEADFDHLLWSNAEEESFSRTYTDKNGNEKEGKITPLQHWFCALADARNEIIHKGGVKEISYLEDNAYKGCLPLIGERLLRESIKIQCSKCGDIEL